MDKYHVRSRYDKHSHKPYVADVIDKYSGEVVYCLHFATKPGWDDIVTEVQRLDADNLVPQTSDNLPTKDQVTIGMLQELLRASLRDLHISPSCLTCSMSNTDMCKEIYDGGCTNYRWKYEAEVRALLGDNSICQSCPYHRDGQCKGEDAYNACPTNHII